MKLAQLRSSTAVLLVLASLGAAACGDDNDGGGGDQSTSADEGKIKTTVLAYVKATAEGDGKTACGQLTEKASGLAAGAQGAKAKTCDGVIAEASKLMKDEYRDRLLAVGPDDVDVEIRGEAATADIDGARATARLVRHEEHWLIDSYGTAP